MKRLAAILTFSILSASSCIGQAENDTTHYKIYSINLEKHLSILAGYNFWRSQYGELGLAINQYGVVGHHLTAWSIFASTEIKIDNKVQIGPKVGAWLGGGSSGMAMGLNLIYYTDFENSSLRFRPEIGIGFDRFKIVYGYNIPLTNKRFEGINWSTVGIAVLIGIKKLKTIQQ